MLYFNSTNGLCFILKLYKANIFISFIQKIPTFALDKHYNIFIFRMQATKH